MADTVRLELLDSLILDVHWKKQVDSALYYIDRLAELAQTMNLGKYYRRSFQRRADLLTVIEDYQAVIPANEARIAAYEEDKEDPIAQSRALSNAHRSLAYALRKVGRDTESLHHYEKSIAYAKAAGKDGHSRLARTLNELGSFYFNRREYKLARKTYLSSLELHQALGDESGISGNLNNLGLIAANTGDYEQALKYYLESLEWKEKTGEQRRIATTYSNIGDIYVVWKKYEEARRYFQDALAIEEDLHLIEDRMRSMTQLGTLALLENDPATAVSWCSRSCAIADSTSLWQITLDCHDCLYQAYKALHQPALALMEYEAYTAIKDSVFNLDNTQEIAKWEARLTYEQELAQAEAEQLQLTARAERDRLRSWMLLGAVLTLALLSWSVLRINRLRKQQNQTLQEKNKQIATDREIIQHQAQELSETMEQKNRFFANISHELRTPLTLVTSPLEQLLTKEVDQLSDQTQQTLSTVQGNAQKLLNLVEELLELAQIEAGNISLRQQNLFLLPFLQQVFNHYSILASDKQIAYEFHYQGDKDLNIVTDSHRLQKVLDNLISNALKFTPEGGIIKVEAKIEDTPTPHLILSVTDTGLGIALEEQSKVFDRYYQAESANQIGQGGTGIGLALAQESAHLLGGNLELESEVGKGSTFLFSLPIQKSSSFFEAPELVTEEEVLATQPISLSSPSSAYRILIVEDNKELQVFLKQVLQEYQCTTADHGQEALQLLQEATSREKPFHLIITDLMMPEMDGFKLVESIKKDKKLLWTKLIVLTARHDLSDKLNLLRFGVDDYLTKPFSLEELTIRVKNLLRYASTEDTHEERLDTDIEPSEQNEWLQDVEGLVTKLLESRQELTANAIAIALNISSRQLLRKIKIATGMSTQLYLQECKLQLARRLLEQQRYETIGKLARDCGFNSAGYFSRVYQERFGKPPLDYLG